jgi:hypothetical protein
VARSAKDAELESREARRRLAARQEPYWRWLDKGCHLGYYKGRESRLWIARLSRGKGRDGEARVGLADDVADADGIAVMDFEQARAAARNWFAVQAIEEAGLPIDDRPFNIVGAPCNRD